MINKISIHEPQNQMEKPNWNKNVFQRNLPIDASALPHGLLRVVVSKPYAGEWLQTAAHEQFQVSVKVLHTDGCEKTELHVDFADQDVDGCGA